MAGIGDRISFRKTQEHVITKEGFEEFEEFEGFEEFEEFSLTPFISLYLHLPPFISLYIHLPPLYYLVS